MSEKPANQDLSQAFVGLVNGSSLDTLYEKTIDATLLAFGRDVIVYLPPARSLPANNAPNYNPFSHNGQDRRLDQSTDDTANKGVVITPIYVVYKAHIKHGPVPLSDENPFSLNENEVAITTVYEALDDLTSAVEIDIDGMRFVLAKGPRPIGFASTKYVISTWTRKVNPI